MRIVDHLVCPSPILAHMFKQSLVKRHYLDAALVNIKTDLAYKQSIKGAAELLLIKMTIKHHKPQV
jgi:hypothetical protein